VCKIAAVFEGPRGDIAYACPVFVDEAVIEVRAGNGGDGRVSFYRAKYIPKGGPDGGDGGDGGSIVLVADEGLNTLYDFRGTHHWHAEHGEAGGGGQCHGRNGENKRITMPPGTLVFDDATGELLCDLGKGDEFVIAGGGRQWRAGATSFFKSSTNQAPRQRESGRAGGAERRSAPASCSLIADAGLVGLPNAGKSHAALAAC
jgi:GTP-binding protein